MNKIIEKKATPEIEKLAREISDQFAQILDSYFEKLVTSKNHDETKLYMDTVRTVLLQITTEFHKAIGMDKSCFLAHANTLWEILEERRKI